jgi:outer membrane murein-binding lipoprotein Lpp
MAKFVTLSCPTCGGKLEITEDIDRFACGNCGNEHIVIRRGGIVSIAPVIEELQKIGGGTDRTASELAIKRLTNEIHQLRSEIRDAKSREPSGCASITWWTFIVSGIVIGFLGIISIIVGQEGIGLGALIFGLFLLVAGLMGRNQLPDQIKEINSIVESLEKQVAEKQEELEQHRRIVKQ